MTSSNFKNNTEYNQFAIGQFPIHINHAHNENKVHSWIGTDSEENFKLNGNKKYSDVDIKYRYNAYGFRTKEFEPLVGQKVDIALGCSFTEGVGLPESEIWSTIIENQSKFPMLNLGVGGGASDTIARIACNVSSLFEIQTMYILWPPFERFEIYNEWLTKTIVPGAAEIHHVWNMSEPQVFQRTNKNKLIVNLLSKTFGFRLKDINVASYYKTLIPDDQARDNMHWGKKAQLRFAEDIQRQ
jgi:hypothetical protein